MRERTTEVLRTLLNEYPDTPVRILAPSTPSDYDTYWHDFDEARMGCILEPEDVEREYGGYLGLNCEKFYDDEDDAIEDVTESIVEGWYYTAIDHGMRPDEGDSWDEAVAKFCGYDPKEFKSFMVRELIGRLVNELPWREYIVIDAI